MVQFKAIIDKFAQMGEKTGWTYIIVPAKVANRLMPGKKTTFRVKGMLDSYSIKGVALLPRGNGDYIMAINATMRKNLKKTKGAELNVKLEADDGPLPVNSDLVECLKDDESAKEYFGSLTQGHKNYFTKWIDSAKTDPTKAKRIAQAITALSRKQDFGQMLRAIKADKEKLGF
jgi:hypothetical protein